MDWDLLRPKNREIYVSYKIMEAFKLNGFGGLPNTTLVSNGLRGRDVIRVPNNEKIHIIQQIEFSPIEGVWTWAGYFKWLVKYLNDRLEKGYDRCVFERDSRDWDDNIEGRPVRAWQNYSDD